MDLLAIDYWDLLDVFRDKLGQRGAFITIQYLQCAYFNETFDQYFFRCVEHMQLDFKRAMQSEIHRYRLSEDYIMLFRKEWIRLDQHGSGKRSQRRQEEKAPIPSESLIQLDSMQMLEGVDESSSDSPVATPAPRDRSLNQVHKIFQILENRPRNPTGFITRPQVLEFCHRMHSLHRYSSWKVDIEEMDRELFRGNNRVSLMDFCLYAERVENYNWSPRDIEKMKFGEIRRIKMEKVPAFNPEVSSYERYMKWCTAHLAIDLFWLGVNPTLRSASLLDRRHSSVQEREELTKEAAKAVRCGWMSLDDDELGVLPRAKIRQLTLLLIEILEPPFSQFPLRFFALLKRNAATRIRKEWPPGVWRDVMTYWDFVTTLSADIGPLVAPTSRSIIPKAKARRIFVV